MALVLELNNISVNLGGKKIIKNISFTLKTGDFLGILGPNGCGKSTIVKTIAGQHRYQGEIKLLGKNIKEYANRKLIAQNISFLMQNQSWLHGVTVYRYLQYGREPYRKLFDNLTENDYQKINYAIKVCDIKKFLDRDLTEISGGELQRVLLAMIIVQDTKILILDEPTNHLDIKYKFELLNLIKKLNLTKQIAIIVILHDINLAAKYTNKMILMKNGEVKIVGTPQKILTSKTLKNIYDVKTQVQKKNNRIEIFFDS